MCFGHDIETIVFKKMKISCNSSGPQCPCLCLEGGYFLGSLGISSTEILQHGLLFRRALFFSCLSMTRDGPALVSDSPPGKGRLSPPGDFGNVWRWVFWPSQLEMGCGRNLVTRGQGYS